MAETARQQAAHKVTSSVFLPNIARSVLVAALMLPVMACAPSADAPDTPRFTRVTLVTPAASGAWAGIWTAVDAGYFADEGLDLQTVPVADTTRVVPLLVSREAQFAAVDAQALIRANSSGADLRAIASVTNQPVPSTPAGSGAEWASVTLDTTEAFIISNPREVTSLVLAYTRGIHRFKSDAAFADQVLRKHLPLEDDSVVVETRQRFRATFDDVPHVTATGLFSAIDAVAATLPAVDPSPAAYVDDSFVTRLDGAGAFRELDGV